MIARQVNRGNKSRDFTLPAPILGLNKRDAISAMQPLYAIEMDNYMPMENRVVLRPGYTSYRKMNAPVKTLVSYKKPNNNTMIGICGNKAYNVLSATPREYSGITFSEEYCQTVQYKTYLYFMNGADTPKVFYIDDNNAEYFTDWGFTGANLQANKIIAGAVSHEFLWFVEKNSLKAWYSAQAGNIQGTLNVFDLSQVSKYGGTLQAIANWTVDGGQGIDDYTVFITSEGEVLVYSGYNPNNASNWELKGSYKISKPIGYQCLLQYQGDIVIICEDGYIPMSKALSANNAVRSEVAFSDAIRGLVIERVTNNKNKQGWQSVIYGRKGYAIFNVPVAQQFEQHVININTGAWCRFTNIRSYCWCLFEDNLYFGSDEDVFKFDDYYSDNGTDINGIIKQAYNNLGTDNIKKVQLLNPRTKSTSIFMLTIYTNMDFADNDYEYSTVIGIDGGTKWDVSPWSSTTDPTDTKWSSSSATKVQSQWIANSSTGFSASLVFKTKTRGNAIEWYNTSIRYEIGNGIL